jgi:hypothetical protein
MSFIGLRRRWFRLVAAGPLLLLLALLPSYLYIDHWGEYLAHAMAHDVEVEESPAEHTTHELHCHYGISGCTEQPAPINGQVMPGLVELARPVLLGIAALERPAVTLEGVAPVPPTQPPQA